MDDAGFHSSIPCIVETYLEYLSKRNGNTAIKSERAEDVSTPLFSSTITSFN